MIIVDSSVWIAYFNGESIWQSDMLDVLLSCELIMTGDLILTEVLQGFRFDNDFKKARKFMSALHFCNMGGYDNAIKAVQNYRALRKKGVTVRKTIDVIIGTCCIETKASLLHNDHDFDPMEKYLGLKVVHPNFLESSFLPCQGPS